MTQRPCLRGVKARKLLLRLADHFTACPGAQKGLAVLSAAYTPRQSPARHDGLFSIPSLRVTSGSNRRCSTPWNSQCPPMLCKRRTAGFLSTIRLPQQQSMGPDRTTGHDEISVLRQTGRDTAPNNQAKRHAFPLELTDWAGTLLSGERAAVQGKVFCIAAIPRSYYDAKLPAAARFFI